MNPQLLFCPNLECDARGVSGAGNIRVHQAEEGRYRCRRCGKTFSERKGTIFHRLQTKPEVVMYVVVLLAYGCPPQAAAKAFGVDERTVRSWWKRAGEHCEVFHQQMVGQSKLDLQHVQADEMKVKARGGYYWMAMALMVSTRLWLGGAVSAQRNEQLIVQLVRQIHAVALCRPLLLAVDGLNSYVTVFGKFFRAGLPRFGRTGRRQLVPWPDVAIVQLIKKRKKRDFQLRRRIVQGTAATVEQLICATQGRPGSINTAYIERLNASFRQRLSPLTRRSRSLAVRADTLHHGMFIVGCFYNFCDHHRSLRCKLWLTERRFRWIHRTPAMAAQLTSRTWSHSQIFWSRLPLHV